MKPETQKIVQYLDEAHATEMGLVRVLQSQISMTPRGSYRTALERHLRETRDHARRVEARLRQLGHGGNLIQAGIGAAETVIAQGLAVAKTPLDLLRGSGGEEKVLKNAKDAAATEALEIATYTAIERLARDVGDDETARLAASIRSDEERMLAQVLAEIPKLTDAVVGSDVHGNGSYDVAKTGAADATRSAARKTATRAKRTAGQARRAPGATRAEGTARGAVAREQDLPIARYGKLAADEIVPRLPELSQVELVQVETYERRTDNRTTILTRIETLRAPEPWNGYDQQTVEQIRTALGKADDATTRSARDYERAHKNRTGVLEAAQREPTRA
jgi:ferritin-like metal-binding protein YciE